MSGLVYPANLPGLTWGSTRTPVFNTGIQAALSSKESAIAYQQYPTMEFELQYDLLRDYTTPSDIKALVGLFTAVGGKYDSFLYTDPEFNTVANMQFATTDGSTLSFQTTATYQNAGGPGGAEIIQNFNGTPVYFLNRFGINEQMLSVSKTNQLLQSQTLDNASWSLGNVTITPNTTISPMLDMTMDSIVESTSTNVGHQVDQGVTVPSAAGTYTFSIYAKPSARSWVLLQMFEATGSTAINVWFNISTGAIGTIQTGPNWSGASATITFVPLGVFKISITGTKTNAATSLICSLFTATGDAATTYTGSIGTVATIAWGAQFEAGAIASMYIPTTTAAVTITDYTLGATGIITTPAALLAGWFLNWSGSFWYRVRFDDDSMTSTQFMKKFWENKKIRLRQRKL